MDRINALGFVLDGQGHRVFVDASLVAGIDGTDVNAAWLTGVQEELAGVIEGSGLAMDGGNLKQLLSAIDALILRRQTPPSYVFTGSANVTLAPGWYRLRIGGAGGGGGATKSAQAGGGGGGSSGAELNARFRVDVQTTAAFTCGAPGVGGTFASSDGGPGGDSSFLGLTAVGGTGGVASIYGGPSPAGGITRAGTGSTAAPPANIVVLTGFVVAGNDGTDGVDGQATAMPVAPGGAGGAGHLGGSARGGAGHGIDAHGAGAGGGGGYGFVPPPGGAAYPGGQGGSGYLILETWSAVGTV